MAKILRKTLKRLGYDLTRRREAPIEFTERETEIFHYVQDNKLTLVGRERLIATLIACRHVCENKIEGDFVECGVWRGGNALLAAEIFKLYDCPRKVFLFDTFGGMTAPTAEDVRTKDNSSAQGRYQESQRETHNDWRYASIEDVRQNFADRGLLDDNLVFVKGDVLETLKVEENLPKRVAVLRLDTDWYESTQVEMDVLYPKLTSQGVLLIDDYGHWAGVQKAVDEYFATLNPKPLLLFTDNSGRMAVKP